MKPCKSVQGRLVAGESLLDTERRHLDGCAICRGISDQVSLLSAQGEVLRAATQPSKAELWNVSEALQARLRPGPRLMRWALASAAMAAGLAVGILVFGGRTETGLEEKVSGRLVALLDDVAPLVGSSAGEASQESEARAQGAGLLDDGSSADDDEEAESLPDSYQVLGEALDNDWL